MWKCNRIELGMVMCPQCDQVYLSRMCHVVDNFVGYAKSNHPIDKEEVIQYARIRLDLDENGMLC